MKRSTSETISQSLKVVGTIVVALMAIWLLTDDVQPNYVQGRMIMGFLMIILGYLMDIKHLLEDQAVGK